MTFVVDANTDADQVVKQLDKVVDVVEIRDISDENIVSREMALIKVKATAESRSLIIEIVHIFRAEIIDVGPESLIVEVTGPDDKIDAIKNRLRVYKEQTEPLIAYYRDRGVLREIDSSESPEHSLAQIKSLLE